MSGWRIVPVATTQDMTVAAYDAEADDFTTMYEAALAAAPEPDWEELAEQIYTYYWNDYDTNGSASLVRALKITLGSKP